MDIDPYEVLQLDIGAACSDADIRKAYRKRALACHPDKVKTDSASRKKAAEIEFDRVKKAYEILCDPEAKKALDDLHRVKKARTAKDATQDAKRRKMREDLDRREKQVARENNEYDIAKNRLQAELERLRKESALKRKQERDQAYGASNTPDSTPADNDPQRASTIKATWNRASGSYTADQLKAIFSEFGELEDVILRDNKKKKGIALVVFTSPQAAMLASEMPCGDFSNPLEVRRLGGDDEADLCDNKPTSSAPASASVPPSASPKPMFGGVGSFPSFTGAGPMLGASHRDYENETLTRMRQAGERARLLREEQEKDTAAVGETR
mmetsp:Transcript_35915/g.60514  ORF Transcript_35915/g.60514 Transcript_35915/m.60514 type:complete len:326 (-) Transcript_35915:164-1141(-)|eukprot:CAMPEP_0198201228 /NCGR_PEP_ID=MMETSP1445-20131203/3978_1 /TAXON_ID=36898 /ORGANISM="Pyramimonas sp., Strain CCMP2087" /LENGTH=325 /DNA_ID=CAMNT_0043871439 /DNA_START=179 /DNA_END=1156 /DNA_ORIENTATION=-